MVYSAAVKINEVVMYKLTQNILQNMLLCEGFPGGAVVENPPTSAGDRGLIPGPGRSRMLRSS